jgi:hypothetical protein
MLLIRVFTLVALTGLLPGWAAEKAIALVWREGPPSGVIEVSRGRLLGGGGGGARLEGSRFSCGGAGPCRLALRVDGSPAVHGEAATLVTVVAEKNPFTFFLNQVNQAHPIFIPAYGVAVTEAGDARSYAQIAADVQSRGLQTKLQRLAAEPEESWENAAAQTRDLRCQTWLGLGRDMRIFAVSERFEWILPRFHGYEVPLPEYDNKPVQYNLQIGRGWGAREDIVRRLEDGVLPILHARQVDDEIVYEITSFVTLEQSPLRADTLRGTHFLVADSYGRGGMMTPEQKAQLEAVREQEMNQPEETVLYFRAAAVNTSSTPRYAFFKTVWPRAMSNVQFDKESGFGSYSADRVYAISRLDGEPLTQPEAAVLVPPGGRATLEIRLPHRPISRARAAALAGQSFDARHAEVRHFWLDRLAKAARIRLPEQRVDEMLRAGLLHLDLVTYGREPDGTLTATIGVYSSIGSESSPIIQFMDSMGWHEVARRSLQYFLDKQHADGFIQNFGGYMLETGAALWSLGEHYRYTRDDAWVRSIQPKLVKSCEYLRQWRARNQREQLRGKGYGMLEGKTADPEDPFRSFMLNGYAYLGLSRVAEMLAKVDAAESARWRRLADELKQDIRAAAFAVMGRSPVIPLGDGSWVPTLPPWAEYRGPLVLYADGGSWFTHGAIVSRDSLLGPLYLVFQEVLDPREPAATFLLEFHNELMTTRNVAFSQPYYSRHPWVHLQRGEVNAFLKTWYNGFASLADRQTYTFWEHYFGASPHKTHEEGWFLMESRWMLYLERGEILDLLPGIPRRYLEHGKEIELERVATYFGPASLRVRSRLDEGFIEATVECDSSRKPGAVAIRLPHPLGRKASRAEGGVYDPATERVRVDNFTGKARVVLRFD